jgi:SRSO17 transposase
MRTADGTSPPPTCAGPVETTLAQLVTGAGGRWRIEECFQAAKSEAGLASYQVRGYTAWYRHITLAMVAHAEDYRIE